MFKFATTALLAASAVALSLNNTAGPPSGSNPSPPPPPPGANPNDPEILDRVLEMHDFFDADDDGFVSVSELGLALKVAEKAGYITFKDACEAAYLFMTLSI